MAGVRSNDFIEPRSFGGLFLGSQNFDNVAVLKFMGKIAHFAVDFYADDVVTNFGVEAIGEVKRK